MKITMNDLQPLPLLQQLEMVDTTFSCFVVVKISDLTPVMGELAEFQIRLIGSFDNTPYEASIMVRLIKKSESSSKKLNQVLKVVKENLERGDGDRTYHDFLSDVSALMSMNDFVLNL